MSCRRSQETRYQPRKGSKAFPALRGVPVCWALVAGLLTGGWAGDRTTWGPYRGANAPPSLNENDVRDFAALGGNLLRVAFASEPMMARTPLNRFFTSTSRDWGRTWSEPVPKFFATGAPRLLALRSGILVVAYRSAVSTPNVAWRVSSDNGVTWSWESLLDPSLKTMEYAAPVELADGVVGLAYGVQGSLTESEIRFRSVSHNSALRCGAMRETLARQGFPRSARPPNGRASPL